MAGAVKEERKGKMTDTPKTVKGDEGLERQVTNIMFKHMSSTTYVYQDALKELVAFVREREAAAVANCFMWQQYTGEYEKQYYDIKLWSGEVYEDCWPNAGIFHEDIIGKIINVKDVAYIRPKPIAHLPAVAQQADKSKEDMSCDVCGVLH